MNTDKMIGRSYNSNNFGKFKIISYIGNINGDEYFKILFENTNSVVEASYNSIRHGRVKDKFYPIVAGVGFIGGFDGKSI